MKILLRILFVAGLYLSFSVSAGPNYFGRWSGTVTEVMNDQRYRQYGVTITVSSHEYRIDYGALNCGGVLHLLGYQGRFFRFRDELEYGFKNCTNGGRIEIHFISFGLAAFQWFDKNGRLKVKGRLKKQSQLMV